MKVSFSPQSRLDLIQIADYIREHNPRAAAVMVANLEARGQQLAEFPYLGPSRPEIRPGLRHLSFREYLILYRVEGDLVEIVRIVHGARDLGGLFDDAPR